MAGDVPKQLALIDVCDCCGGLSTGRGHPACRKAWDRWLRADNLPDWQGTMFWQDVR